MMLSFRFLRDVMFVLRSVTATGMATMASPVAVF